MTHGNINHEYNMNMYHSTATLYPWTKGLHKREKCTILMLDSVHGINPEQK